MPKNYTLKEFAALCGITVTSARRRVQRGSVRAEKLGNYLFVITGKEVERLRAKGKLKNLCPAKKKRAKKIRKS
jgi:hypothetical protein